MAEIKFAETLKELTKKKDITQAALARHLGVKPQTVSAYYTGRAYPEFMTLVKIASYFDVSVDFLINGEDFEDSKEREELKLSVDAIKHLRELNYESTLLFGFLDKLLSDDAFYTNFSQMIITTESNSNAVISIIENNLKSYNDDEKFLFYKNLVHNTVRYYDEHMREYFKKFLYENTVLHTSDELLSTISHKQLSLFDDSDMEVLTEQGVPNNEQQE